MYFNGENGYINLLKDTLANGENKKTRNGNVVSAFGSMINFKNINECFPLITTKKMFFRGIVEELLWFLRGSTNANELKKKNVHIWDGNSTREYLDSIGLDYPEGELGPVYGWQWRKFGKEYGKDDDGCEGCEDDYDNEEFCINLFSSYNAYADTDTDTDTDTNTDTYYDDNGVDQIKYIIEELLKEDSSRRAVLSGWNPVDLKKMALPPCHILYIFNKSSKGLSCHMTLRSSDLFLGLPFNIASTALLTQILAHVLHINASEICLSICDAHIYEEHISQVNKQVNNEIYELPKLIIKKDAPDITSSIDEKIRWIESLVYEDFELSNYKSHAALSAIMK
jgi:thymidylate synthase